MNEYHVLLREAEENAEGMCKEALVLGEDLITKIKEEDDFPQDYLANVQDKVNSLKQGLGSIESDGRKLADRLAFLRAKQRLYLKLEKLFREFEVLQAWSTKHGEAEEEEKLEGVERLAKELSERWESSRKTIDPEIPSVKQLAGEVTLLPGAFEDPSNRVKEDVYTFCDKWQSLEADLANREEALARKIKKLREVKAEEAREMSRHERELVRRLEAPAVIMTVEDMQKDLNSLRGFMPRMDIGPDVKTKLEDRLAEVESDVNQLQSFQQEIDGLFVWMREVDVFLNAEEAAFGDRETLEAQLKESNALQDDIQTLKPNVTVIRETGENLSRRCVQEQVEELFDAPLENMIAQWDKTVDAAKEQNRKLSHCLEQSIKASEGLSEISSFVAHLRQEVPGEAPVTQASELSQRTYKLMQLRERVERRRPAFGELQEIVRRGREQSQTQEENPCEVSLKAVKILWDEVSELVMERHSNSKAATAEYGEFKTLFAQESDWLERLEKKLRKGSAHTAADAEEISEELDDIENFLNNHPEERLSRLGELARSLETRKVLVTKAVEEAQKLKERWLDLAVRAKKRTDVLEGEGWQHLHILLLLGVLLEVA